MTEITETAPPWDSLPPEEQEFHYNPQRACPNFEEYRRLREPANAAAHRTLRKHADVAYGDHPLRALDVFPAAAPGAPPSPVHVFFHGGYWRAQDKQGFAFIAPPLVAAGVTCVVANYELCPGSTLDEVAESALACVAWVRSNIGRFGGDPDRISLSGHSAGAHLCAEALACDWAARGLDPGFLRGAVMISGIYDPAPAMRTTVNAQLRLTPEIAARRNLEHRPPLADCPVSLFAGGAEPWRWIDQTFRYSHHLRRHGRDPEVHVLPGRNHFDIVQGYAQPASPILGAVLRLAR